MNQFKHLLQILFEGLELVRRNIGVPLICFVLLILLLIIYEKILGAHKRNKKPNFTDFGCQTMKDEKIAAKKKKHNDELMRLRLEHQLELQRELKLQRREMKARFRLATEQEKKTTDEKIKKYASEKMSSYNELVQLREELSQTKNKLKGFKQTSDTEYEQMLCFRETAEAAKLKNVHDSHVKELHVVKETSRFIFLSVFFRMVFLGLKLKKSQTTSLHFIIAAQRRILRKQKDHIKRLIEESNKGAQLQNKNDKMIDNLEAMTANWNMEKKEF